LIIQDSGEAMQIYKKTSILKTSAENVLNIMVVEVYINNAWLALEHFKV